MNIFISLFYEDFIGSMVRYGVPRRLLNRNCMTHTSSLLCVPYKRLCIVIYILFLFPKRNEFPFKSKFRKLQVHVVKVVNNGIKVICPLGG